MKRSRYSEEKIIEILRENEAGMTVADLCRKHGMSSATFYGWKAKFGGMDVSARALLIAEKMIQDDQLEQLKEARYAGWTTPFGQNMVNGKMTLDDVAEHVLAHNTDTRPVSGRQERLENLLNTYL